MEPIERLHHEFLNIEIKDLGYGANLYTRLGVITIYWGKKKKYCINGKWEPYSDFEQVLFDIAARIRFPKKVAPIEPEVPQKSIEELMKELDAQPWQIVDSSGVQKCIDHISCKRDFINANQPDNKLATFCLTLMDELKAYL